MTRTRSSVFAVAGLAMLFVACGSSPAIQDRYYSLVLAGNDSAAAAGGDAAATSRLIVGPVQLPSYLLKQGLPTQVGPNSIETAHHHFWAEPLDQAIAKVLARDIAKRTNGIDVERESGRFSEEGSCRVRVEIDSFQPTNESRVVTSGRYWITSANTSNRQGFNVTRPLTIDGYAHAVDVLRGTLEALAQQISDEVQSTPACTSAGGD